MTEEDLAQTYEQAMHNALIYGTGFVKVALVNGKPEVSVVDPRDYRYIEPIEEIKDDTSTNARLAG